MSQASYVFTADPGHAWLEVPMSELWRLGIADKISRYSYRLGTNAYLEEDCDAALFIEAKKAEGWEANEQTIDYRHVDDTPIRRYASYWPSR